MYTLIPFIVVLFIIGLQLIPLAISGWLYGIIIAGGVAKTILEKTIANAMNKSLNKGSLYSIDTLLTRVYGKPKEQYDIQQDTKIEVVFVEGKTIL